MNHAIIQNTIDPLQGQRRVPHRLATAGEPRTPLLSNELTRAVKAPLIRRPRRIASRGDGGYA
ncbi:MAG: hypothetical protein WAN99_02995 [Methanoculleus sp.]